MLALLAAVSLAPTQTVHRFFGPMPTGIAVSKAGRVFVTFPRWGDPVAATLVEIVNGREVPYPNLAKQKLGSKENLICVQSVVVDPKDRLWAVDAAAPKLADTLPGGPKLVLFDLKTNRVERVYHFPETVAKATTYLNDVRFDLTRGKAGYAFVTDSSSHGQNAIIVLDLATGESWRRLDDHPSVKAEPGFVPVVEGQKLMMRKRFGPPTPVRIGVDGIAIVPQKDRLYYCPLIARKLYSVSISLLIDRSKKDEDVASGVTDEGTKPPSDGLIAAPDGTLFITDYPGHRVQRRNADGSYSPVLRLPAKEWPDTLAFGPGGWLYVTANQLQRQKEYRVRDLRQKPYRLVRARVVP